MMCGIEPKERLSHMHQPVFFCSTRVPVPGTSLLTWRDTASFFCSLINNCMYPTVASTAKVRQKFQK